MFELLDNARPLTPSQQSVLRFTGPTILSSVHVSCHRLPVEWLLAHIAKNQLPDHDHAWYFIYLLCKEHLIPAIEMGHHDNVMITWRYVQHQRAFPDGGCWQVDLRRRYTTKPFVMHLRDILLKQPAWAVRVHAGLRTGASDCVVMLGKYYDQLVRIAVFTGPPPGKTKKQTKRKKKCREIRRVIDLS